MSIRSVPVNNSRLTEGQIFPFRILKLVELDQDEKYWVMQDPRGFKILMPAHFYNQYGFEAGQIIQCRIDKINCNGKMFLEPRHPHYQEGQIYSFPVVKSGERINLMEEKEYFYIVKDVLNCTWKVRTHRIGTPQELPADVSCIVERIKKGKLFLRLAGEQVNHSSLVTGQWYPFQIMDEKFNPEDRHSYFILSGPDKQKHFLKKKYYIHYGLKKENTIQCRVDKFSTDGFFLLEPQHPCYETGQEYDFEIDRLEELTFSDGFRQKVLVLNDCFQQEVKVHIADSLVPKLQKAKKIKAEVTRIRKSRPELILNPDSIGL